MPKMKIAHVLPYFYPHIGGVETFAGNLVKGLAARGHEVTVITGNHEPGTLQNDEDFHGARVQRVPITATMMATPIMPRAAAALKAGGFDIAHTHTPPPLTEFFAAQGAASAGIPLVLSYHGDPAPNVMFGGLVSKAYRNTFGLVALRKATRIIVHTRTYAATSKAIWRQDPIIIPSAVDAERFSPANDGSAVRRKHGFAGKKVALFVGRLVDTKGIDYFIRSAQKTSADTVHLIVGAGELLEESRRTAAGLGLSEKVVFAGKVGDEDLPSYYAACDVFVLPSVSRLEGFGLVTLEAMATGKPVIVSDIPGVREVIVPGEDGLLAEPMNPGSIAENITKVLSDDALMRRLGAAARRNAETKYSWPSVVGKIESLYAGIVEK